MNRVVYDPEKVNLEQMEQLLQQSGTYIRTVSDSADVGVQEQVLENKK